MDAAKINVRAVRAALPRAERRRPRLQAENERLLRRVQALEEQLRRERSRSEGLACGVAALSERVAELRTERGPAAV